MIPYASVITEDVATLQVLERKQWRSRLRDRVRMLRYLKSGTARSLAAVAPMLGLCVGQVRKLFALYRKEGLDGLLRWRFSGNHRKIARDAEDRLVAECSSRENGFSSQSEVQSYVASAFGVQMSQPGVSVLLARKGIRLKTGRPRNVLSSEQDQQEYKKNSRWK